MNRVPNPILGPNKFKFGLFNANCDGGFAISKAPERWRCEWDDVVKACVIGVEEFQLLLNTKALGPVVP